jgi:hypothetical protein
MSRKNAWRGAMTRHLRDKPQFGNLDRLGYLSLPSRVWANEMTTWRLQRRHLSSTPSGTKRAKRLPQWQRMAFSTDDDCFALSCVVRCKCFTFAFPYCQAQMPNKKARITLIGDTGSGFWTAGR